jgi:hypothetical protein
VVGPATSWKFLNMADDEDAGRKNDVSSNCHLKESYSRRLGTDNKLSRFGNKASSLSLDIISSQSLLNYASRKAGRCRCFLARIYPLIPSDSATG